MDGIKNAFRNRDWASFIQFTIARLYTRYIWEQRADIGVFLLISIALTTVSVAMVWPDEAGIRSPLVVIGVFTLWFFVSSFVTMFIIVSLAVLFTAGEYVLEFMGLPWSLIKRTVRGFHNTMLDWSSQSEEHERKQKPKADRLIEQDIKINRLDDYPGVGESEDVM